MRSRRLFLGIPPEPKTLSNLADLQSRLSGSLGKIGSLRWVEPQNVHLTLHFLGNVEHSLQGKLEAALESESYPGPHQQEIGEFFAFPRWEKARVFGVGSSPVHAQLGKLQSLLAGCLNRLGLETEKRAYYPHVTLARLAGPLSKETLSAASHSLPFLYPITRFCLYDSVLSPKGAQYVALRDFPLAPPSEA